MKKKIILSALIIIVVLANYTRLKVFLGGLPVYNYRTETNLFKDSEIPWKGIQFNDVKENFEFFKKNHSNKQDTILYRTFKMYPLKFWHWNDYATHERYKLPYKPKK